MLRQLHAASSTSPPQEYARTLFWTKLCATGSVGKVPHGYLFGDESGEMDQASVLPKNEEAEGKAKGTRESHPGKESEGEQVGV